MGAVISKGNKKKQPQRSNIKNSRNIKISHSIIILFLPFYFLHYKNLHIDASEDCDKVEQKQESTRF
jgi:hypothetical protein